MPAMEVGEGMPKRVRDRRRSLTPISVEARTGADRRVHERVLVDIEVDYKADETFLFAYITDISAMGIFIRTNAPEPPGTRLNLRFQPQGGPQLNLEGRVMWVNPYRPGSYDNINPGMGVQFVDLSAQQREQIVNLVRTFAYLSDDEEPKGNS
jgi:type IV pilus assembly protein PilZ